MHRWFDLLGLDQILKTMQIFPGFASLYRPWWWDIPGIVMFKYLLRLSCINLAFHMFGKGFVMLKQGSLQFTSLLDLSYLESMHLVSWMLKVPSRFHSPTLLHQLFCLNDTFSKIWTICLDHSFVFLHLNYLSMVSCCVCVFTSTVKASSVWNSWDCQRTDQQCCVEDVGFLWFPSSLLWNTEPNLSASHDLTSIRFHDLTSIRLAFRTWGRHSPLTGVVFGTQYIVSWSAFASALRRGFAIYLGKVEVTTNFSIESSPQRSI